MFNSLRLRMVIMVGLPILLVNFGLLFVSATQQKQAALIHAEDLSRATIREESLELQSLLDTALSSANLTAGVFQKVNDSDNPLDMGRESATLVLKGILDGNEQFIGAFSVWEPDAFDMMDVAYGGLPGNSEEGRFSPYWKRNNIDDSVLRHVTDKEIAEQDGWYEAFRKNQEPSLVWDPSSILPDQPTRVIRALYPITTEGKFLGVVGVDICSEVLEKMVSNWSLNQKKAVVHLHTTNGILVAPAIIEQGRSCEIEENKPVVPGIFWKNEKLVACREIESSLAQSNLVVSLELPRTVVLGAMQKKMQRNTLIGLVLLSSVFVFIGYFIKKNLARLVILGRFTRKVSQGEKFEEVIDDSPDEIGELVRDFQSMLHHLQEAESERQESLTRLEAILDSVQAGIVIIDPDDRTIIDANPAALKMMGHSKDDVVHKICHGFMCPAEANNCPILDLDQKVDGNRKILLQKDGSELVIFKTVIPIELKGKKYLLETFVDVDQQVKAENALSEKLKQISQAKKQQDILVSHAVSREERMVNLKIEVNGLLEKMSMTKRYQAPDDIEAWRQEMARDDVVVNHES